MTLLVVSRNLHLPYAQDWNLNIQRSFGEDWLFQVGYVGTTGVRLPRFIEGNPAVFVPGVDTTSPGCAPQTAVSDLHRKQCESAAPLFWMHLGASPPTIASTVRSARSPASQTPATTPWKPACANDSVTGFPSSRPTPGRIPSMTFLRSTLPALRRSPSREKMIWRRIRSILRRSAAGPCSIPAIASC